MLGDINQCFSGKGGNIMKNRVKKFIGAISAIAILMGMAQSVTFAAGEVDYSFDNKIDSLNAGDSGKITCGSDVYIAEKAYVSSAAGKKNDDFAIEMKWEKMPHTAWGLGGFELPYYSYTVNNDGDIRTMELSFKYNEGCDYAVIQSSLATKPNGNHKEWQCVVDWVKFVDGKVYVVNTTADGSTTGYKDTGIAAEPNQWYRIVVEANYTANKSAVYVNGNKFVLTNIGNAVRYIRWTQARAGLNATGEEGTRDVSVAIDDVKIYTGAYNLTDNNKVAYTGDSKVTVDEGATAADVLKKVNYSGAFVLASLNDTVAVASDAKVADGSVVVLPAADGKTFGYVDVAVTPAPIKPVYSGEVTKVMGENNETDAVGFYGTFTGTGVVDQTFGIKVKHPEKGYHDFTYTGTITGDVVFGLILRGLSETECENITAEFLN